MKKLLIHAWALYRIDAEYYIPYTHWIYVREIKNYFNNLVFLSPVKELKQVPEGMHKLKDATAKFSVIELPWYGSYVAALKHFFAFRKAYRAAAGCSHVYVRYPVPFGWLSEYHFAPANRIIHFVGDPLDTIRKNKNFSAIRKKVTSAFFLMEYKRYLRACLGASVFTNGIHLQQQLQKQGVRAQALVSSSLTEKDFYFDEQKSIDPRSLKLVYAGYLRKAKGLDTLLDAFRRIHQHAPGASLTIIGDGERKAWLLETIKRYGLEKCCVLTGHIEERERFNALLRGHDIFIFTSISEGSPRVILEAMANGLNVVSTPVGSLPGMFSPEEELLFAQFNDAHDVYKKVMQLAKDPALAASTRMNAFNTVKQHTLQAFIARIFSEI